jgi:hypothetical protein
MLEQKWQNSLFATQKQENDWVYTPNQGALRCVPPAPLSRLAGYALAVRCDGADHSMIARADVW